MPKLPDHVQAERADRILDAAERVFSAKGFHGASIQAICSEAGISAGALYVYFASKEALIEGICERERRIFSDRFRAIAEAPDVLDGFGGIILSCLRDDPIEKRRIVLEIGAEAARNDKVAAIYNRFDAELTAMFRDLIERLASEGRIAPLLPPHELTEVLGAIGDGMLWRSVVHQDFDVKLLLPGILATVEALLRPNSRLLDARSITRQSELDETQRAGLAPGGTAKRLQS
ncbi:MAG: TetR/AcrR family transcriptional regulator [Hyphomicrobiaceae bacterium]